MRKISQHNVFISMWKDVGSPILNFCGNLSTEN